MTVIIITAVILGGIAAVAASTDKASGRNKQPVRVEPSHVDRSARAR